jgi:hypothetical protein
MIALGMVVYCVATNADLNADVVRYGLRLCVVRVCVIPDSSSLKISLDVPFID